MNTYSPNKYIIVIFILFIFSECSYAQDDNTTFIVGGNLSLVLNKRQNNRIIETLTTSFSNEQISNFFIVSISPYLGKAINESSYVGIRLPLSHSSSRSDFEANGVIDFQKTTNSSVGIGIFYRKLFTTQKRFHYYIQPSIGYSYSFGKIEQFAPVLTETKGNTYQFNLDLGAIYNLTKHFNLLLEFTGLNYSYNKFRSADNPDARITNRINILPNLNNIRLGIERKF